MFKGYQNARICLHACSVGIALTKAMMAARGTNIQCHVNSPPRPPPLHTHPGSLLTKPVSQLADSRGLSSAIDAHNQYNSRTTLQLQLTATAAPLGWQLQEFDDLLLDGCPEVICSLDGAGPKPLPQAIYNC